MANNKVLKGKKTETATTQVAICLVVKDAEQSNDTFKNGSMAMSTTTLMPLSYLDGTIIH